MSCVLYRFLIDSNTVSCLESFCLFRGSIPGGRDMSVSGVYSRMERTPVKHLHSILLTWYFFMTDQISCDYLFSMITNYQDLLVPYVTKIFSSHFHYSCLIRIRFSEPGSRSGQQGTGSVNPLHTPIFLLFGIFSDTDYLKRLLLILCVVRRPQPRTEGCPARPPRWMSPST